MFEMLLPILLLAGGAAAETDSASGVTRPVARAPATARARIVKGEPVRFGNLGARLSGSGTFSRNGSYALPMARSSGTRVKTGEPVLMLTEFH